MSAARNGNTSDEGNRHLRRPSDAGPIDDPVNGPGVTQIPALLNRAKSTFGLEMYALMAHIS